MASTGIWTIVISSLILLGLIYSIIRNHLASKQGEKVPQLTAEKEQLNREVEQLKFQKDQLEKELIKIKQNLENVTAEKNQQVAKLEASLQAEREKGSELQKKISRFESEEAQRDAETDRKLNELNESRRALEKERERVIEEERKQQQKIEENRNRIWNEHEKESIIKMNEICKKKETLFTAFNNNNLPDEFVDSKFKPDFILKFLGQYIIFDAKLSKGDLNSYIKTQVSSTVKKIKNSSAVESIYKTVFFVVPTMAVDQIKEFNHYEEGYRFFVIPIEAFEPIVASFKKLEDYDLADKYDPQERENVINLIAAFDHHIRKQNAVNIINSLEGLKVLGEKNSLPTDIQESIEHRVNEQSTSGITPTKMNPYIKDPIRQIEEIQKLVQISQPPISKKELKEGSAQSIAQMTTPKGTPTDQEFDFD